MLRKEPGDEGSRRARGSKSDPPPAAQRRKAAPKERKELDPPKGRRRIHDAAGSEAIVITPANLIPNQINVIAPPPAGYPGRALLWPPPPPGDDVPPSRQGQYTFALYFGRSLGPVAVHVPNIQGFLFADLKEGVLPPSGSDGTIFDALEAAINAQIEPPPPEGTDNDAPQ